jgi:hypothetical protein
MARKQGNSRQLRQLAELLLRQVPDEALTSPRPDLATSLVRQWLTYENHATLIWYPEQHYFRPAIDAGGELRFDLHPIRIDDWFRECMADWEFGEEERDRAIEELNIAQSSIIENHAGQFLRLSIDPKERIRRVERLGLPSDPVSAENREQNRLKLARRQIEHIFHGALDEDETDEMAAAVVRQFEKHRGHALVVTMRTKIQIIMEKRPDGLTQVTLKPHRTRFPEKLRRCGLSLEEATRVLHAVNLGHQAEVIDEFGRRCRVVTEPESAQIALDEIAPAPPGGGNCTYFSHDLKPRA